METVAQMFAWILDEVAEVGYLSHGAAFIDGTHIKVNVNTKKHVKAEIPVAFKMTIVFYLLATSVPKR